jgi:hypothetical protein
MSMARLALRWVWHRVVLCPVGLHDWQCVSARAGLWECEYCGKELRR